MITVSVNCFSLNITDMSSKFTMHCAAGSQPLRSWRNSSDTRALSVSLPSDHRSHTVEKKQGESEGVAGVYGRSGEDKEKRPGRVGQTEEKELLGHIINKHNPFWGLPTSTSLYKRKAAATTACVYLHCWVTPLGIDGNFPSESYPIICEFDCVIIV